MIYKIVHFIPWILVLCAIVSSIRLFITIYGIVRYERWTHKQNKTQ